MTLEAKVILEGLMFGEGPRWHEDKLWLSDMYACQVITVSLDGKTEIIAEVPGQPSGLGWLPDGRLLVVSMTDKRLLRLDPGGLTEVADLSRLVNGHCNDMVVDKYGRAYIGHFGFDLFVQPRTILPAQIIMVTPEGDVSVVADEMIFPNGTVITPDGRTLIVAESFASRLTAFDIAPDGSLTGRRVWADFGQVGGNTESQKSGAAAKVVPDGICLDAENAVWIANPAGSEVIRVGEGGEITHRVKTSQNAYACMLGGMDRRTLCIITAGSSDPAEARAKTSGCVEIVRVEVPGAGLP